MKKNIFKTIKVSNSYETNGNLALSTKISDFDEELKDYEEPKVKKLVIVNKTNKIFMGCWQGSYTEQDGDGC